MTVAIDKTYRKQNEEFDTKNQINKYSSFVITFLRNLVLTIPIIILVAIFSFIAPFIPHTTYGFGGETPATFKDYLTTVLKLMSFVFIFFLSIVIIATVLEYLRMQFDIRAGYKKIGNFRVTKIWDHSSFKSLHLNNGHRLKVKSSDKNFNTLTVGQIIEIERTASHKFLNYKILVDEASR